MHQRLLLTCCILVNLTLFFKIFLDERSFLYLKSARIVQKFHVFFKNVTVKLENVNDYYFQGNKLSHLQFLIEFFNFMSRMLRYI